jgi:hypothetical protein
VVCVRFEDTTRTLSLTSDNSSHEVGT